MKAEKEQSIIEVDKLFEDPDFVALIARSLTVDQVAGAQIYLKANVSNMGQEFSQHFTLEETDGLFNMEIAQLLEWVLKSVEQASFAQVVEAIFYYYNSSHPTPLVLDGKGEVAKHRIEVRLREVIGRLSDAGLIDEDEQRNLRIVR